MYRRLLVVSQTMGLGLALGGSVPFVRSVEISLEGSKSTTRHYLSAYAEV